MAACQVPVFSRAHAPRQCHVVATAVLPPPAGIEERCPWRAKFGIDTVNHWCLTDVLGMCWVCVGYVLGVCWFVGVSSYVF